VPDVARIDLAGPVLDLLAWGGEPRTFDWFAPPSTGSLEAALQLLSALGAVENGRLTATGRRMAGLPAHPRLARILIEAGGSYDAAVACAMLSDRQVLPHHPATTTCDLLAGVDGDLPPHIASNARELQRLAGVRKPRDVFGERDLRRALLTGYPDRVGQRRTAGDPRVLLPIGHGALIGPESGVRDGEFILALDVQAAKRGQQSEARIRVASIVEREWLVPTGTIEVNQVDEVTGVFRTVEREMYGAIVLKERPSRVDPAVASVHLARTFLGRPLADQDARLVRRLRFAGIDVDLEALVQRAAAGTRKLDDLRLESGLEWGMREKLEELAPSRFTAPSGRIHTLDYREDGTVALSIKLQELFGLAATPRFGPRRQPLLMVLLAPNGRAVQTTTDLKSFWNSTYPEVRKELRGRYPRHPWPEDPWEAAPTARTTRRRS
jgi:ATP-dependent helicase HrpB